MRQLTGKGYREYSYTSRYTQTPYYYHKSDDKYVMGLTSYLDNTTVYKLHVVEQGDTIDNLALYYYNNPTLYWIICSFNRITDPYKKLVVGEILKIPSISNIQFDLTGRG